MKSRKIEKVLAILLTVAMCLGMVPATVFADETDSSADGKEVNLVVFGSSTAHGYGMPDSTNTINNGFSVKNNLLDTDWTYEKALAYNEEHPDNEEGHMSIKAYPWQLKKYIEGQDGVSNCNLIPVCLNGMRTDELRAFLDEDFYQKACARERKYAQKWLDEKGISGDPEQYCGFLKSHMNWYMGNFVDGHATTERSYDAAQKYVKDSIEDADVIVVDVLGNNFGTYIGYRVSSYLGMEKRYAANTYETIDDIEGLPNSVKEGFNKVMSTAKEKVALLNNPAVDQLLNAYLYGAADCIVNFSAEMKMINQLNPDAKVIVVGLNNPMLGLKLKSGDTEINIGQITGKIFDLVNTYVKGFDGNANNYSFADIPANMTTFASTVADAESLAALLADGEYKDGLGHYAIDRIYNDFVDAFMGGTDGDSKIIYSTIQDGIKAQAPEAAFKSWDDLSGDDAKVTFDPGTFYLTADQNKLAQAATEDDIYDALGFSQSEPAEDKALTRGVVRHIAIMYKMSKLSDAEMAAIVEQAQNQGIDVTIEALLQGFIYDYIGRNMTDDNIEEAYILIQNGVKGKAPNASDFSELDGAESATFKPGTMYVTYNTKATNLTEAFNFSLTDELPEEDQQKGIVILTKGLIKQITAGTIKPVVQQMLYEAVSEHQAIDMAGLIEILTGEDGMAAAGEAVTNYIAAKMQGGDADLGAVWGLITIEERFLLSSGVGEHPSAKGCDEKFQAVKKAYDSDDTAFDEAMAEVKAMMKELVEMLRQTGAKDDIDAIIAKINQIQAAMAMLDDAQASMEELKQLQALKAQFEEYFGQALDLLGITVDDLIAQGEFIKDNIDPVWIAEQIKMMNEIINNWPELKDEYREKLEEYARELMNELEDAIKELVDEEDMAVFSEIYQKILDTVETLRELAEEMPKSEEEFKEFIEEHLDDAIAMIEEAAAGISEDLAAQIRDIADKIKDAVEKDDYQALIDELLPIGEKLLAIGQAVAELPEYQEAMQEYVDASKAAMDGLDERVTALETQLGHLTAKSIKVDVKPVAKFGKKTSSVELTWEFDEDASGYDLTINGKAAEPYGTKDGMKYVQDNIKVGETYKYEVTPYVYYEVNGEMQLIKGKTYKKTFVPKVTLKKAALKKVKAGKKSFKATWKKVAGADGYKLSYKLGKKNKSKLVKKASKVKLTVKKLKAGKNTVKVRAYKTVNGKKYYGAWSKAKKVKIK